MHKYINCPMGNPSKASSYQTGLHWQQREERTQLICHSWPSAMKFKTWCSFKSPSKSLSLWDIHCTHMFCPKAGRGGRSLSCLCFPLTQDCLSIPPVHTYLHPSVTKLTFVAKGCGLFKENPV